MKAIVRILAELRAHQAYQHHLNRMKREEAEALKHCRTREVNRIREQRRAFVHGGWKAVCR